MELSAGADTIGLVPPRPAPRASMRCARPPTLPSCSAFPRCRRIAASSLKILPIRSIPGGGSHPHRGQTLPGQRPVLPDGNRPGNPDHHVPSDPRCSHAQPGRRPRHRQPASFTAKPTQSTPSISSGRTCRAFTPRTAAGPPTRTSSGKRCLIGKGLVDFRAVFTKLHRLGLHRRRHHRARNLGPAADRGCDARRRLIWNACFARCSPERPASSRFDEESPTRIAKKHGPP